MTAKAENDQELTGLPDDRPLYEMIEMIVIGTCIHVIYTIYPVLRLPWDCLCNASSKPEQT